MIRNMQQKKRLQNDFVGVLESRKDQRSISPDEIDDNSPGRDINMKRISSLVDSETAIISAAEGEVFLKNQIAGQINDRDNMMRRNMRRDIVPGRHTNKKEDSPVEMENLSPEDTMQNSKRVQLNVSPDAFEKRYEINIKQVIVNQNQNLPTSKSLGVAKIQ